MLYEVFNIYSGQILLRTPHFWLARLLTFPLWHGPEFIRRLWDLTGFHDYDMVFLNPDHEWLDIYIDLFTG